MIHILNTGFLEYLDSLELYQDGKVEGNHLILFIFNAIFASTEDWDYAKYFGGYDTLRHGKYLASQGGLNISRVELLLWYLWKDRHTFLAISMHIGQGRQWSPLFFVFTHFILAHRYVTLSIYFPLLKIIRRGDSIGQILDLSHRYSLSATEFYDRIIAWLTCSPLNREPSSSLQINQPVDRHDSVLIAHLFVREIHPETNAAAGLAFCALMPRISEFGFSKITSETCFLAGYCAEAVSCRLIFHLTTWPAEIFSTLTLMEISTHLFNFIV